MLRWLSDPQHEELTHQFYQAHAVPFGKLVIITDVSYKELQIILPVSSDTNPNPSEPGPHEYWYGCVDNLPFLIIYYHGIEQTHIITFLHPSSQQYFWSTLNQLNPLPKPLLQRISWLGLWISSITPVKSIYCQKASVNKNSPEEVYQSSCIEEAEALFNCLLSLQSEYSYYIGEPNKTFEV